MRTIATTIHTFDELSDGAKEKAREWWRACENAHGLDVDFEDFEECANRLGIELKQRHIPLMNGSTRNEPTIYYSGFSSQGDGASFEGHWEYKGNAVERITEHAPNDEKLLEIATVLDSTSQYGDPGLSASIERGSSRYYHEYTMSIDVCDWDGSLESDHPGNDEVIIAMQDFARWIYRRLESEYNYRMSDENVDESIQMNEYEFTEDGAIH